MDDTSKSSPTREGAPKRRRLLPSIGVISIAGLLAIVVAVFAFTFFLGDPDAESLRIVNRSDETLRIFARSPSGSEQDLQRLVPKIPPRASVETELYCAVNELVARNLEGELVARRGPFEDCNLEDWIIETPGG